MTQRLQPSHFSPSMVTFSPLTPLMAWKAPSLQAVMHKRQPLHVSSTLALARGARGISGNSTIFGRAAPMMGRKSAKPLPSR